MLINTDGTRFSLSKQDPWFFKTPKKETLYNSVTIFLQTYLKHHKLVSPTYDFTLTDILETVKHTRPSSNDIAMSIIVINL